MKAILNHVRISPKKANLVAGMVVGKPVEEALALLKFLPKKAGKIVYKVVHSAAYNAKNNNGQSLSDLIVSRILVTPGPTYKRALAVSRGRSHPILKRTANITVEVAAIAGAPAPKAKAAKAAAPKAEVKAEAKAEKPAKAPKADKPKKATKKATK